MRDRRRRSIAKTVSFRVIATVITFVGVLLITKDLSVSILSSLAINAIKGVAYYIHERGWEHINWARDKKF